MAVRLGAALWRFWDVRGHFGEARERLAAILSLPGASEPSIARAKALTQLGYMTSLHGDQAAATDLLDESLELCETIGFALGKSLALVGKGIAALNQGRMDVAESHINQALKNALGAREAVGEAVGLFWLGELARLQGKNEQAIELLEEGALAQWRSGRYVRARICSDQSWAALDPYRGWC